VIAFEDAYHGDTFGYRGVFSKLFDPFLFEVEFIPVPVSGKETEYFSVKTVTNRVSVCHPAERRVSHRSEKADGNALITRLLARSKIQTAFRFDCATF
jgi:adenosylmethionine-8-amino-7-oxononanoate aminotransferase